MGYVLPSINECSVEDVLKKTWTLLKSTGILRFSPAPNSLKATTNKVNYLNNVTILVRSWEDRDQVVKGLFGDTGLKFLEMEFKQWFSNKVENPGEAYKWAHNPETWASSLMLDGGFYYTYQDRLWSTYPAALNALINDYNTRQAFISIWNPVDIQCAGVERIPCTIGYHFETDWSGRLNCTMIMRSTDAYNCLANDIWLGTHLLEKMVGDLGTGKIGTFTLFTSDLHLFVKDESKAKL